MNPRAVVPSRDPVWLSLFNQRPSMARCRALLIASLALGGCNLATLRGPDQTTVGQTELFRSEAESTPIRQGGPSDLKLDDDPVYKLLVAEFAGKRDQLPLAVKQYVDLAHSTRDPDIAERATRIALFAEDNTAALACAKLWVSLAPTSLDARQLLAASLIRQGEADAAFEHLKYVLDKDRSSDSNRFHAIASLLGHEEDARTALSVMESLAATRPKDTDAQIAFALLAMRAEDVPRAEKAMNKLVGAVEIKANLALAYVGMLQKARKSPEALGFLERALKRSPDDFGLRLLYARLLTDGRRYEDARAQFTRLDKLSPANGDVLYALGLLNLQAGKVDLAERNFLSLVNAEDRRSEASFYLGQIEESRGKTEAALTYYRAVTNSASAFPATLRMATLLANDDRLDNARALLAASKPTDAGERTQLSLTEAEILTNHQRFAEAMAVYDRALNGIYDMPLLYNRAMLAERMGKLELLEQDLKTIIEREPDNQQALNALGFTLADRTTRYEEARGYIERALQVGPRDFYVLDSMGWVLFKLGKVAESLTWFEQAQRQRDDPEVAAHLGEALWTLGRQREARAMWEAALRKHPNDPKLLATVKRLAP